MNHLKFCLFLFFVFIVQNIIAQNKEVDHYEAIIFPEDDWSYFIGKEEPQTGWTNLNFNDSHWKRDKGGFGYGDGDDNTQIEKTISLYLRKTFEIKDINKVQDFLLHADYDDAFVAYINGVEIARANIGTVNSIPSYDQTSDTDHEAQMYSGGTPDLFKIKQEIVSSLLVEGENILSVQVHNHGSNSSDLTAIFFLSVGISDASFTYKPMPAWFNHEEQFTSSNLPIVVISTNGVNIPDEPKINVQMGIIDNGTGKRNSIDDQYNIYNGTIGIEIRGSSSQMFPKKSYGLETRLPNGDNNNVSILGMPKENDWVLYAPYSDKSLMRNVLTYHLGNQLGHYAPRTKYCELIINDDYKGTYVFIEKIKRDKNRVNISSLSIVDIEGDNLTGGYIIKIDRRKQNEEGWKSPHAPYAKAWQRVDFVCEEPDEDEIQPQQKNYIETFITEFENTLNGNDFNDETKGYRKYINLDSFIDYLIINELTRNVDGYRLSTFMHKDKDSKGGKLYLGPLWDYNLAFGNADYCEGSSISGWAFDFSKTCPGDPYAVPFWWNRLIQDQYFVDALNERWRTLRKASLKTENIHNYIDSVAGVLSESQKRNFVRWPVLGKYIWPNNVILDTYEQEIDYLKNWIRDRAIWLDQNIEYIKRDVTSHIIEKECANNRFLVYPNPFRGGTSFSLNLQEKGELLIEIYDISGKKITSFKQTSDHIINGTFSWNGKNSEGQEIEKGIYICNLIINNETLISKKLVKI